jgi:hypothetical protein
MSTPRVRPLPVEDLVEVAELCKSKRLPMSFDTAKRYCRDKGTTALKPTLPAVKVRGVWMTTEEAVERWLTRGMNSAMRRIYT